MPPKYKPRKKRPARKRNYKKRVYKSRIGKMPTQKIVHFKRDFELATVDLTDNTTWPTGWYRGTNDQIVATMVFALTNLPGYGEFKNLFEKYKLNHVVMKMYSTSSQIITLDVNDLNPQTQRTASNILVTTWNNRTGQPLGPSWTRELMNQVSAKKTKMFPRGKPFIISCKLNQLAMTYRETQTTTQVTNTSGATVDVVQPFNIDYGVCRPKYLNTVEDSTPHYGMNLSIKKLDDTALISFLSMKVVTFPQPRS